MKRLAAMMGALLLDADAGIGKQRHGFRFTNCVSRLKLWGGGRRLMKRMGGQLRWIFQYISLNEKELAVYDCSAYTDYIKNPNNEDKTNVYAYNENLKEFGKRRKR